MLSHQSNTADVQKHTIPTVKHGDGSIMLMPGRLVKVEVPMNAAKTREILAENLKQSATHLQPGRRFVFQQNNDPKYKAKDTQGKISQGPELLDGFDKGC